MNETIRQFVFDFVVHKIENGIAWGMFQRDNNPTKAQKTAQGHQSVFKIMTGHLCQINIPS